MSTPKLSSKTPPTTTSTLSNSISLSTPTTPHVTFNDDKTEKRRRRESLLQRRKILTPKRSAGSQPSSSNSMLYSQSLPISPMPKISMEQMHVNFEEWLKMATDNKINAHNSWKLELIDYFYEMSILKEGDSINFQKASCTLDGCVKIYTSRVDSVATETGKLLSGLTQSNTVSKDEDDEDIRNDGFSDKPRYRARRSSHKKLSILESTLVQEFSTLKLKRFELEFSVDPLFKKTCADFDEGGAGGLLLNHLSIGSDGQIILDSGDSVAGLDKSKNVDDNDSEEINKDKNREDKMNLSKLRAEYRESLLQIFDKDICSSLKDLGFSIKEETETELNTQRSDINNELDYNNEYIDTLKDDDDVKLENNYNTAVIGETSNFYEYAESNATYSQYYDILEDDIAEYETISKNPISEKNILITMADNNDYFSYFDASVSRSWMGPEHWKIRCSNNKENKQISKIKSRGKQQEESFIDFKDKNDIEEQVLFSKNAGSSTAINLPRHKENNNHLLLDDMQITSQRLLQLFNKRKYKLTRRMQYDSREPQDLLLLLKDNNVTKHFCEEEDEIAMGIMDEYNIEEIRERHDYDEGEGNESLLTFSPPKTKINNRLETKTIKFAKYAKKVDVRKLKENLWKVINDQSFSNLGANGSNGLQPKIEGEKKLTDIMHGLKQLYSTRIFKDISTSFCFVCLLYLASEKNLVINKDSDSDLLIVIG
ncbi:2458_t:CDS:2 [Ambispora gerdemannii]|uniref:Condensin complex subunit 2 n=1 Tax=Ambispora gerdemannii TaxID=144530 RepID=A0A9N8VHY4_9GLOM|nr:2458_t:CDS:2 [Ambispora gerdemannii]